MCMFNTPKNRPPFMPREQQAMTSPDDAVKAQENNTRNRLRSGANTILTGGSGVQAAAPTAKATILGG